ncbi:hypothetical protein XU18_3088 [Perkinsela sp. CCAP 1560/4]|nr:hypothetical protein XU18_3088 [Perkinsela sp. CCAP 1560/4]|eukprot:KNH05994.1 hypothetical protein XU18_3088 [Perkinsela sp. CCAP 1560/4]
METSATYDSTNSLQVGRHEDVTHSTHVSQPTFLAQHSCGVSALLPKSPSLSFAFHVRFVKNICPAQRQNTQHEKGELRLHTRKHAAGSPSFRCTPGLSRGESALMLERHVQMCYKTTPSVGQ